MSDGPGFDNDDDIQSRLLELRQEHEDLGAAVEALSHALQPDQIRIARLKKKKLALRDQIVILENQAMPDIIA